MFNLKFLSLMERQMRQKSVYSVNWIVSRSPGPRRDLYMGSKYVVRTCLPARGNGNPGPRGFGFARLGPGNLAASGLRLGCGKPLVSGQHWVGLLCTNGLRKRSSGHVEPLFLGARLFSRSVEVTMYHWHSGPRAVVTINLQAR